MLTHQDSYNNHANSYNRHPANKYSSSAKCFNSEHTKDGSDEVRDSNKSRFLSAWKGANSSSFFNVGKDCLCVDVDDRNSG